MMDPYWEVLSSWRSWRSWKGVPGSVELREGRRLASHLRLPFSSRVTLNDYEPLISGFLTEGGIIPMSWDGCGTRSNTEYRNCFNSLHMVSLDTGSPVLVSS